MEENLPFRRKCELLEVSPSTVYSRRQMRIGRRNEEDIELARKIEDIYVKYPFYGSRRMAQEISRQGTPVNRKRVQRLMQKMGLVGVAPGPKTSKPHPQHKKYPYLLKDVKITRPNQVWSCDITYIPTRFGFLYLAAVIDWYSRRILACRLSNTMDVAFCTEALEEALGKFAPPEIFNTDQGAQFTSDAFSGILEAHGIAISMDGKGRAFDNIFIERFWRNVKYEWLKLHSYDNIKELRTELKEYLDFYNFKRIHESLGYKTPEEVYSMSA